MANLRLAQLKVVDSKTIKCRWSDNLSPLIGTGNITITSITSGVPDVVVQKVKVSDNLLTITTLPMTPYNAYLVTFAATDSVQFKSLNGTAFLVEDGKTNVVQIQGPEEPINNVRDNLITYLKDNVYNLNKGTFVRAILDHIAGNILRAKQDIFKAKNDNYLSFLVTDEFKIRGPGAYDRLNEENAYEVIRVAKTSTATTLSSYLSYDSFPSDPVTLKSRTRSETLVAGSGVGTFDKLIFTLSYGPVIKVDSINISYADGYTYNYSITQYGYQLHEPRYDTSYASTLLTLEDNQVKLSDLILEDDNFRVPEGGDTVSISYNYKSLGRYIDDTSVVVSQVVDVVREPVPAETNEFSLKFAPVVTSGDQIPSSGGVSFLDPSSTTPFLTIHPAFTTEIPFSFTSVPKNAGEYAIDYATGRVFVFGATDDGDGTGEYPPAATYKYRKIFVDNLDYTYDPATDDLAASPIRDLATQNAKISFSYEDVLIPDVDYIANTHIESLNERIGNKIKTLGSLGVANTPITNVFRVFNETSGEIYKVSRFSSDTVYFTYNSAPRISNSTRERSTFKDSLNNTLIVNDTLYNTSSVKIFKILLDDNNIMSATDDLIGASYNTSVTLSRNDIFEQEIYYDGQILDAATNIERLAVGKYQIDYRNGIIYVGVASDQDLDIGTISYKKPVINPNNQHVISVSDIFYSLNANLNPTKHFNYSGFDDGEITPTTFDYSDERFLNGDITDPYIISANTITVTYDIKAIRHIYDAYDLNNNDVPTDFGTSATFSANVITLDPTIGIEKQGRLTVDGSLNITVSSISPGIEIGAVSSVLRVSDGYQLLDGYETILGNVITLSGTSGAIAGDIVDVVYTVILNSAATPIVDYDHGGHYITYSYLADEILVSYEYGDNVIDWRESDVIEEGGQYYVTYRVGALRDSLLQNFGTLVNLPEVTSFDVDLSRELYRDSLIGALQSFTKGPTIPAIETIVSSITKIRPNIIESIFTVWSLGISRLFRSDIVVNGSPQIVSGKFDGGLLCSSAGQSVEFDASSNLRLEEGTLQLWVIPEWDGYDNDATLTFSDISLDGYALDASNIYIGSTSYNPTFNDSGEFSINRTDSPTVIGIPAAVYTANFGLFIYYNDDEKRWNMLVKNSVVTSAVYTGTIVSSGEVYDVKFIENLGEASDILRSGQSKIEFELNLDGYDVVAPDGYISGSDGYVSGYSFDGITWMADEQHYLFDLADEKDRNRFSLYKDGRGYLNFEIWDRGGQLPNKESRRSMYSVSADIQDWLAGEKHNIAAAWKLNTINKQDEMHLFIDGFEVPNIMRYGGRPEGTSSDRFRTVKPEIVAGTVPKNIIAGNDLVTTQGSDIVYSDTVDFSAGGIVIGDTIMIDETGFTTYTIIGVSGNFLTLSSTMPATLTDASFSVNPYAVTVSSKLNLYTNIAVSVLRAGEEIEIPGVRAEIPGYSIYVNALNETILTILGNALVGDTIVVRTLGLNHRRARDKAYIWTDDTSVLRTALPPPIDLDEVSIVPVLLPLTPIGPDNATISLGNFVATGITTSQPVNATEGRGLAVRITGGNVDFSTSTTVTINGTTAAGPLFETLTYTTYGTQYTTNKFKTISSVDVTTKPYNTTINGTAIEIKERYSITAADGNSEYAVIRYAYQRQNGSSLTGDGSDIVTDLNGFFSIYDETNILVISSPPAVAGTYQIVDKIDDTSVRITPTPSASFTGGIYSIYNVSISRSGFQNGFFFFETAGFNYSAYPLPKGYYELDYSAYLEIPFSPMTQKVFVGNDYTQQKPAKAVIDELRILSTALTDTRTGETLATGAESITTGYISIRPFVKNSNTLMLLHFDDELYINDSDYYIFANREYIQSANSVNTNFGQSIVIRDKGLSYDNNGVITTNSSSCEGAIEFWVSPLFDTYNDPNVRMYFDATSAVVEEVASITKGTVQISGRTAQVLSVRLITDTDATGTDYFAGGSIADDRMTINLGTALPFQKTPVKISYLPSGLNGDRISIYKDSEGFITFNVRAMGNDYQVRQPVLWPRNSWHRVRTTFKFNRTDNNDEIRLFVDGEERGVILFGSGLMFGDGIIFGQTNAGQTNKVLVTDINFRDSISKFYIGQDYSNTLGGYARIDNLKISNISKDPVLVSSQPIDVNWNANLSMAYPSIEDAFTTFLLDFERLIEKTEDFAELRDASYGIFNFTINIIDSFGIVTNNQRIKNIMESMILSLKPANSKVEINYV